jgi:hypothetical protein
VTTQPSANLGAPPPLELLERLKAFLSFGSSDVENIRSLAPIVEKHGSGITDRFYVMLGNTPETAKQITGRVDALKRTHAEWMRTLVGGDYGEAYLVSRWRIGQAHVRTGLQPYWVEGIMSFIRTEMLGAMTKEITSTEEIARTYPSFCKACDLDLLIINLSYAEDRLDRVTDFTGMKRTLVENIIRLPRK